MSQITVNKIQGLTTGGNANTIVLNTSSTDVLTVNSSGNVSMSGNLTVDTSTLHVDSVNNRVGIGTATPAATLQLSGSSFASRFDMINTAAGGTGFSMYSTSDSFSQGGDNWMLYHADTTAGIIKANRDGTVVTPNQVSFLGTLGSTQSNVTGDSTTYTVTGYTETYDVGDNFNGTTGVFTAPVTGKYFISSHIFFDGLNASHTSGVHSIVTSNRTYSYNFNPLNMSNVSVNIGVNLSVVADMDAGDTASNRLFINFTNKTIDVSASTTKFIGYLLG